MLKLTAHNLECFMNRSKYTFIKIVAILLLMLLVILSGFILYVFPYKDLLNQSHQIKYGLAETGFSSPIIYLLPLLIKGLLAQWRSKTA